MRTIITIDYISVNGIDLDRKGLDKKAILNSMEKMVNDICIGLVKHFKSQKVKTKIVHLSE